MDRLKRLEESEDITPDQKYYTQYSIALFYRNKQEYGEALVYAETALSNMQHVNQYDKGTDDPDYPVIKKEMEDFIADMKSRLK